MLQRPWDHQIDLVAIAVTEEVQLPPMTEGHKVLHDFHDDEVFIEHAAQGVGSELSRLGDAHKAGRQSDIVKVELGRLDEAFRDDAKEGR